MKGAAEAKTVCEPEAGQDATPTVGTLVANRYRIESLLGKGGMSVVLSAWDERLERPVALKLLRPSWTSSPPVVGRFAREARTLARVDSPHVIRVLDLGAVRDPAGQPLPYLTLELLRGRDLWKLHHEEGPLDAARIVGFVLQACAGLVAAHAAGVVHRDLKPENLFVTARPDGTEHLVVLDFGIARQTHATRSVTRAGEGLGTPSYMSPEQIGNPGAVDSRSDIWSLGIVLYELLAGHPPFRVDSSPDGGLQIAHDRHQPLAELRPDLPEGLSAAVERCLALEPEERFASATALACALAPFARSTAFRSRPPVRLPADELEPIEAPTLVKPARTQVSRVRRSRGAEQRRAAEQRRGAERRGRRYPLALPALFLAFATTVFAFGDRAPGEGWTTELSSAARGAQDWLAAVAFWLRPERR